VSLNLPNSITFFRVVLVPVLMAFLLVDVPYGDIFALVVFVVAAASDSLDGYLARRFRQTTVIGAFLDPLADKLIVTAALVSLVELGELSAWVAMVVIARELAVTGLRMVSAVQGTVIPASKWGKAKTASQMVAIAALIIEPRWLKPEWTLGGRTVTWYLVLVMLILTVVSGVDYFIHARQRLQGHLEGEDGSSDAAPGGDQAMAAPNREAMPEEGSPPETTARGPGSER
jgi:CDP-diacylglycerol--glycerol-3-phosphate 3-phosphatidyltransferase